MSIFIRNFPISKIKVAGEKKLYEGLLLQPCDPFDPGIAPIWINERYELNEGWARLQSIKDTGAEYVTACIQQPGDAQYFDAVPSDKAKQSYVGYERIEEDFWDSGLGDHTRPQRGK